MGSTPDITLEEIAEHLKELPGEVFAVSTIWLANRGLALALEVAERNETETLAPASLDDRIIAALAERAMPLLELRAACRVRSATLQERISALTAVGRIVKTDVAWRLAGS